MHELLVIEILMGRGEVTKIGGWGGEKRPADAAMLQLCNGPNE